MEPNSESIHAPLHDWLVGLPALALQLPIRMVSCLVRRLFIRSDASLGWELFVSVFKSIVFAPRSIKRSMMHVSQADIRAVTDSRRFVQFKDELCEHILRPGLAGYWVCRGAPGRPQPPAECDMTVLFIFGGSYVQGHPLSVLYQLLRVWELMSGKGVTLSIFALQYTWAPEAQFPTQINQATAGYEYIVKEMNVDPSRVVVMGESAGGHLALSTLYGLKDNHLPKPGGALLLYPWINLTNSGKTYQTNANKDILDKSDLDECVNQLLGVAGRQRFSHLLNFAAPIPDGHSTWNDILPKTWITVGAWDLFLADNIMFAQNAKADGVDVDLLMEDKQPHAWTRLADKKGERAYLNQPPGEKPRVPMPGADRIAEGLLTFVGTSVACVIGS